jgi:excinuclease ABC subunit C
VHLKEKIRFLPDKPGVYILKDAQGDILYIGKATSLLKRVPSYFQHTEHPKIRTLQKRIADLDYIITESEEAALILEADLVKKHEPRYNVRLKDDKKWLYIKVTREKYPKIYLTRDREADGAKYYGPYTDARAARRSLQVVRRLFPLRCCDKKIDVGEGRPCLDYQTKLCSAPCNGRISLGEYVNLVDKVDLFLTGRHTDLIEDLSNRMFEASDNLEYEKAASLRDQINAVNKTVFRHKAVLHLKAEMDVIALAKAGNIACVQLFFIRGGRITGRDSFLLEGVERTDAEGVIASFVKQYYSSATYVPRELILQYRIREDVIQDWLGEIRGLKVYLRVPKRGRKLSLIKIAAKNAEFVLRQHITGGQQEKQIEDALRELQIKLNLPSPPSIIEGFDISNIQGTKATGSVVVFRRGTPAKRDYRRFKIKSVKGSDDIGMLKEVVKRRYSRGEKLPDLILVDGGRGQLNAVLRVLKELGIKHVPAIGLAKEFEYVFAPGKVKPIILAEDSKALHLLQRVRDEAHRFALAYHRKLKSQELSESILDNIPGIGKQRKKGLFRYFGSIEGIKNASVDELQRVSGINKKGAERIFRYLHEE